MAFLGIILVNNSGIMNDIWLRFDMWIQYMKLSYTFFDANVNFFDHGSKRVNCKFRSLSFQGRISLYKFLVPCLSVRIKFTNQ